MIEKLSARLQRALAAQGVLLARAHAGAKLAAFLEAVRPVTTNHELVRVGARGDGGYLLPDDFVDLRACFSPGVDVVASFEEEVAGWGVPCFLADYSVAAPPIQNPLFDFEKKFLGSRETAEFITLDNWVAQKGPFDGDLLLQMDIEGAEYEVLLALSPALLQQFRIIVVEFHELHRLFDGLGFQLINAAFAKLLQYFEVVHIHPNNCTSPVKYGGVVIPPVMEFTFLRKDRVSWRERAGKFPHPLDFTNVLENRDFPLPKCWY